MTKDRTGSAGALLALSTLCFVGCATFKSQQPDQPRAGAHPVEWDEQASQELAHELHRMHEAWNKGDILALKELLPGDDVLVTFELDPQTDAPIQLKTKSEIDTFVDNVVLQIRSKNAQSQLEMPFLRCRATKTFGVCTEECTTHLKMPDGTDRVDRLWSTAVAVKKEDGWRWIQWHMSVASPPEVRAPAAATSPSASK